jgi:DNA recombination protein RmuC
MLLILVLAVSALATLLAAGALTLALRPARPSEALLARLDRLEQVVIRGQDAVPAALREEVRALREELRSVLGDQMRAAETRFVSFAQEVGRGQTALADQLKSSTDSFAHSQGARLGETNAQMQALREGLEGRLDVLTVANGERQAQLRQTLADSLDQLRKENDAKLEQMRLTVDEKLQGTLEKRLGESFQIVSDRLEAVHKGLGEMQSLAAGVGDLKRVLTNVKSRGGWGEVQLGMLLEDMLTPDQYAANVAIEPGSAERVEYAVRLPGRGEASKGEAGAVYLPIDAKFPHEDYDRLLAAQELGLGEDIERAASALERAVRLQAKTISAKYVHPPYSTDFAIMYLPTEGLFAEVIRRPGLMMELQHACRVMVTGPTTLAAILNSLQMGFRTVAIERRSSEVWQVLAAAKAEFRKYGDVWDRLGKQLATAQNTVSEAGKRTRAVERRLRDVETLEMDADSPRLSQGADDDPDDEADAA